MTSMANSSSGTPASDASPLGGLSVSAVESPDVSPTLDDILSQVHAWIERARTPRATYRLQWHVIGSCARLEQWVEYLDALGISEMYCAPILQATADSGHGYDIVDHDRLHSTLGTTDDLERLALKLGHRGMGLLLDVVPNHMSIATTENRWWWDVLENGRSSPYATYFDIDWFPVKTDLADRVLLPVLGDQYGKTLESGHLRLELTEGSFQIAYFQRRFPVAPRSYSLILESLLPDLRAILAEDSPEFQELLSILTAIQHLPERSETAPERCAERRREKEVIKRRLRDLLSQSSMVNLAIQRAVERFNGTVGDPRSFDLLETLLDQQAYRLASWRVAAEEINYRRFFDVNELAAISTEHPDVFRDTHRVLLELIDRGIAQGIRIDHPDGLADPGSYLRQLQEERFVQLCRQAARRLHGELGDREESVRVLWRGGAEMAGSPMARPLYVIVEKILGRDEPIPADWPVHGTVGYEFLTTLDGLFVQPQAESALSRLYQQLTGETLDFPELSYQCKRLIQRNSLSSEFNMLAHRLDEISLRNRWTRDFTLNSLGRALAEILAGLDVYRTYVRTGVLLARDREYIEAAVAKAKQRNPAMDESVFDFVRDVMLLRYHENADERERGEIQAFVVKCQQLSGPLMAKSIEDTAFYRFNRLVSLNEVGGHPEFFGATREQFHLLNQTRRGRFPWGLSATTTHDTKRSEDVRARIHVLSEIPREWSRAVRRWMRRAQRWKTVIDGQLTPCRNDEYLLYQTLIGTWSVEEGVSDVSPKYIERIQSYMLKVAREAKVHTSWIRPHAAYEQALNDFVGRLLNESTRGTLVPEIRALAKSISVHGRWNSLAATLLKIASPGVPDFYQGAEVWTHQLVDPDNRRSVDLDALRAIRDSLDAFSDIHARHTAAQLLQNPTDPRLKLFVTQRALEARRACLELFVQGEYRGAETCGPKSERLIAFTREYSDQGALVVVPRWTVGLTQLGGPAPVGACWEGTRVRVPESWRGRQLRDAFTERELAVEGEWLEVAEILATFPCALLVTAVPARMVERTH